jgi:hypothetical protein
MIRVASIALIAALLTGCGISTRSATMPTPWPNELVFINDTEMGSSGCIAVLYGPDAKPESAGPCNSESVMGAATTLFGNATDAALVGAAAKFLPSQNVNENLNIALPPSAIK